MELWGEIVLNKNKDKYDIDIITYKNNDVDYLNTLHYYRERQHKIDQKKNKLIRKVFTNINQCRFGSRIKTINNKTPENLIEVHRQTLKHRFSSHNGMMCYTYKYTAPKYQEYDIYNGINIPHCVYHNIKGLFHTHEFHDPENDTILKPYCTKNSQYNIDESKIDDSKTWEEPIKDAIKSCLTSFQMSFHAHRRLNHKNVNSMRKLTSLYGSFDWIYTILSIVFIVIILTLISYLTSIEHMMYLLPTITLTPICVFIILRWCSKIQNNPSTQVLRLEGEYGYAKSLLTSKYIENDKECKKLLHNIKNDYMVAKAYVEEIHRGINIKIVIYTVILSIIFLIGELVVAYGLDNISTKTIFKAKECVIDSFSNNY